MNEDQFKLLVEQQEIIAQNAADKAVTKVVEILECYEGCRRNETDKWMGFTVVGGRMVPITYLTIGAAATIGLFLGIFNLLK